MYCWRGLFFCTMDENEVGFAVGLGSKLPFDLPSNSLAITPLGQRFASIKRSKVCAGTTSLNDTNDSFLVLFLFDISLIQSVSFTRLRVDSFVFKCSTISAGSAVGKNGEI